MAPRVAAAIADLERLKAVGGDPLPTRTATYYLIRSQMRDPWKMTAEAEREALRSWLCKGCRMPKPGAEAVDVAVQFGPGNEPLKLVMGAGLGLLRRDLLLALGEDVVRERLHLGKVYGEDGRQLTKWATLIGKRRLLVRGSKNARYRRCGQCGQVVYYAEGQKFLHPATPPDVPLFDAGRASLVLSRDLFLRSHVNRWHRKLHVCKLAVPDAPLDGLDELSA